MDISFWSDLFIYLPDSLAAILSVILTVLIGNAIILSELKTKINTQKSSLNVLIKDICNFNDNLLDLNDYSAFLNPWFDKNKNTLELALNQPYGFEEYNSLIKIESKYYELKALASKITPPRSIQDGLFVLDPKTHSDINQIYSSLKKDRLWFSLSKLMTLIMAILFILISFGSYKVSMYKMNKDNEDKIKVNNLIKRYELLINKHLGNDINDGILPKVDINGKYANESFLNYLKWRELNLKKEMMLITKNIKILSSPISKK